MELGEGKEIIKKDVLEKDLKELVTIFNKETIPNVIDIADLPMAGESPLRMMTVYMDGVCNNNGLESATAESGVWYGDDDPCNQSIRVPLLK